MNIYNTRQILRTKTIRDLDIMVAYYARVSTDKDEQKTSLTHQREVFDDEIAQNPHWRFGGRYIDEAKSGLRTSERTEFNRMIQDAKSGKFDMIITKEISRFARNTLDSIRYTRELLMCGVCVWFTEENINTIDEDSEFRLTILAGMAQDESRRISNRVKFGHARSIKNGVVMGNSRIYGYDKLNGKLIINHDEAEMVRFIFEKYATGMWSTGKIRDMLYDMGYRNHNGGKIDKGVIGHIICNPKYKGFYAGGKVKIIDMFTKKQEFLPPDQWIMYKDESGAVPAIVDEETWTKAFQHYQRRGDIVRSHRTSCKKEDNIFTGLLLCGVDGAKYWLKLRTYRGRDYSRWVCSNKLKNGADACPSFWVSESELKAMVVQVLRDSAPEMERITERYIEIYRTLVERKEDGNGSVEVLPHQIELLKKKDNKLLDYNLKGVISDDEFIKRHKDLEREIHELESRLESISPKTGKEEDFARELRRITERVRECASRISIDDVTRKVVTELFSRIVITPTGEETAKIEFFLNGGREAISMDYPFIRSDDIAFNMFTKRTSIFWRNPKGITGKPVRFEYTYSLAI